MNALWRLPHDLRDPIRAVYVASNSAKLLKIITLTGT